MKTASRLVPAAAAAAFFLSLAVGPALADPVELPCDPTECGPVPNPLPGCPTCPTEPAPDTTE